MVLAPRRIAAAAALAGAVTLITAPASHAVVDPIGIGTCLSSSAADATTLVDPTAPGVPAEVPGVACLAP
ncbi:hypothetical protein [Nonomuraea zeae]|uniref:Chaplin n=1 Tax=Nonomuraea zeae TaxID=1642303 RepID=A0A5S4FZP3_9ACTN|nr:hypothetical protein [Nonomuraea zeae]TMR25744.1 hypothetical protein ETD85_44980 [Nonomuraea zeae]